jgi:hypothetical protein
VGVPEDALIRKAVGRVAKQISGAETRRALASGEPRRSYVFGSHGDRLRFIVPSGYDDLTDPLVDQFGSRIIVEVVDGSAF